MSEEAPAAASKQDPAGFALRAAAPRPVRIRRGALIGMSACAVALVSGAVMLGLRSPAPIAVGSHDETGPSDPSASSEALASAPTGYAAAPALGPPLTGFDMLTGKPSTSGSGQPTLAPAPDGLATANPAGIRPSPATTIGDVLKSPVMVPLGAQTATRIDNGGADPATPVGSLVSSTAVGDTSTSAAAGAGSSDDPNRQNEKAAFVRTSVRDDAVNPHPLTPAASRWIVSAGSIIAASLITGLNSDLPGDVIAQVTEPVYDSPTGRTLLIPQGARLIGSNDNVVSYGQKRALIVWKRMILPDGASVALDNWAAADKAGFSGLTDRVDAHSWQLIKGVALSTVLGIGSELSYGSSDGDLARALRQSAETGTDRAGQQLVGKSLDVQPTIRVRPGWPVRVVVHQDLLLQPWRASSDVQP